MEVWPLLVGIPFGYVGVYLASNCRTRLGAAAVFLGCVVLALGVVAAIRAAL